jgi:predicted transcriptional regulator
MAKVLSVRLDDETFAEMERVRKRLKLPRNAYIRKTISHYNALHARKCLARDYRNASRRLGAAHLEYLKETELLEDL